MKRKSISSLWSSFIYWILSQLVYVRCVMHYGTSIAMVTIFWKHSSSIVVRAGVGEDGDWHEICDDEFGWLGARLLRAMKYGAGSKAIMRFLATIHRRNFDAHRGCWNIRNRQVAEAVAIIAVPWVNRDELDLRRMSHLKFLQRYFDFDHIATEIARLKPTQYLEMSDTDECRVTPSVILIKYRENGIVVERIAKVLELRENDIVKIKVLGYGKFPPPDYERIIRSEDVLATASIIELLDDLNISLVRASAVLSVEHGLLQSKISSSLF